MKKIILLLFVVFTFSSCATILTGTRDNIQFNSTPEGATVYQDGLPLCKTPCEVSMKRSIYEQYVKVKLKGYKTRVITLDRQFNVVSVINLGELLGWAIDVATGSIMKYSKFAYNIKLTPDVKTSFVHPKKIDINTKTKVVNVYVVKAQQ